MSDPKSPDNTLRTSRDEVIRRAGEMGDALRDTREALIRRRSNPQMPAVVPPPPKDTV